MTEMREVKLNGLWPMILPEHRAARREWTEPPYWEKERLDSMRANVERGDVVFDIGAEEGDISALLAQWARSRHTVFCERQSFPCDCPNPGGLVLFEPNPRVWPNIRAIWEANNLKPPLGWWVGFAGAEDEANPPRNDVDQTARCSCSHPVEDHHPYPPNADGASLQCSRCGCMKEPESIMRGAWPSCAFGEVIGDHGFRHLAQEADRTPQIRLDSFSLRTGLHPDVITMDVEGAEWHVLAGAAGMLTYVRPIVYVSIHPGTLQEWYGLGESDVLELMAGYDYAATFLAEDHERHWVFHHPDGRPLKR